MVSLLLYYVVGPIVLGWLVFRFLRRVSPYVPPEHVQRHFSDHPPVPKQFRATRQETREGGVSVAGLGDFEKLDDAVDAVYLAREQEKRGAPVTFVVYNDRLEPVQQVDPGS